MRLATLHLERYGHFTDRSLSFRPDARLHVVFGPNEAGKSSALNAVTDLLFGIPRRTPYDFQRDGREMSLGAELRSRHGDRLVVQRRKGLKRTLFGPDGAHLGEDALAPWLGGLTREVFCRAFGLDAGSLRQGAQEMLTSDGEIGASLFAAASGLRGLSELRRALDEEAEAIYAPRGRNRTINQLIDRREQARKAIKAGEVRAPAWKQLNDSIDAQTRRLDEIADSRSALIAEEARLKRLKRVAPLVQQIDRLIEELDGFARLPELPDGTVDRLAALLAERRSCAQERDRAEASLQRARAEFARVTVEDALLAEAARLIGLFSEEAAYTRNRRDLPRIAAEAEEFHNALAELAVRIGLPDAASLATGQPSEAARVRAEGLAGEGRKLEAAAASLEQNVAESRERLAALERARAERGGLADPTPLRQGLEAMAPVLRELHRRDDLARQIADEARAIARTGARLAPPVSDVAALAQAVLPDGDTVAEFGRRFEALARAAARSADLEAAARAACAESEARLAQRGRGRAVPSADALAARRADRDAAWGALRAALLGGAALSGSALLDGIARFERGQAEADHLADAMASDAQRAAEQAADLARLTDERAKAEAAAREREDIARRRAELGSAWAQEWAGSGIAPRAPAEMATWLAEARTLLARAEAAEERRADLAALTERIEALRPALIELARKAGQSGLDTLEIGLIASHLNTRLDAVTAAWEAARDAESRLRAAQEQVEQLEARRARAAEALAAWRGRWQAALPDLGLAPEAGLDEAEAALAAWRDVPVALRERDNRERRVAGMRRDIRDYEERARDLVAALAPDMLELPPDQAVAALHRRLQAARAAEARRDELGRLVEAGAGALAEADERLRHAGDRIEALAATIGAAAEDDLDALHERLAARQALQRSLAARRAELATHAEHVDEAVLRDELAALAPGELDAQLARLTVEHATLERSGQETYAERVELERHRRELEDGVGAEIATAQKRAAEAELREAARRWAVLKLGATLIATAMERHRTGQQDPLVTRAGLLFRELTGGAFEGLAQDYDEADVPRLAGRRASGELVHVDGLSEGTRDQLYLALRLAYLDDYAARAEPAPFIGDDLFSTFDDTRTVHGLKALAAIGDRIQPILFTHHRHVADLAERHLGEAADIVAL